MAQLVLTVMLDGLMALLLIITTVYCWRLNKRIRILQDSRSELAQIIRQFDESTQRATDSIGDIHQATLRIAENIQHKIDKANYLADDLQFMIEKGSKLADKMEGGISANRSGGGSAPSRPSQNPRAAERAEAAATQPQRNPNPSRRSAPEAPEADAGGNEKARSSLESMLKRVAGNKPETQAEQPAAEAGRRRPGARMRSKAEQELFEALKSGNTKA